MKRNAAWLAFVVAVVIPFLLYLGAQIWYLKTYPKSYARSQESFEPETQAQTQPEDHLELSVIMEDGTVKDMDLESYVTGVVLAEMPADFEPDALKAQAVAARTYALKRRMHGGKHDSGAVCTNNNCCQAFCSPIEYESLGGTPEKLNKVINAVNETEGLVLLYQGELIDATYFSSSGGKTEDAYEVWGQEIPYLKSVDSPGEDRTENNVRTIAFQKSEFEEKLSCTLDGDASNWIANVTYTAGGGVATIQIGDQEYTGTQIRQLLGLNSTVFQMTAVGQSIIVTTKGFGHRVGMSQYGADAMAVAGYDYVQILEHYYPGTTLQNYMG